MVSASLRILQWSLERSLDVSDGLWELPTIIVPRRSVFRGPVFAKKSSAATMRRDSFEPPPPNKGKVGRIHDSAMDAFALLFFARLNAL